MGENKVLGIKWLVHEDIFIYKVNPRIFGEFKTTSGRPTKRELLSFVMSIFDPLGLIAFVTIGPKLLLRETWKQELDWDDQIPENMMGAWKQWIYELEYVDRLRFPRWYGTEDAEIELHIFCDAGENAKAAAASHTIRTFWALLDFGR